MGADGSKIPVIREKRETFRGMYGYSLYKPETIEIDSVPGGGDRFSLSPTGRLEIGSISLGQGLSDTVYGGESVTGGSGGTNGGAEETISPGMAYESAYRREVERSLRAEIERDLRAQFITAPPLPEKEVAPRVLANPRKRRMCLD